MLFLKCPKNEKILELVSIAKELPRFERMALGAHMRFCADCRKNAEVISERWKAFFQPEPDLTPSLLRVYSRLRQDETLVIKGWKLNDPRLLAGRWRPLVESRAKRWIVSGGLASAIAATLAVVIWTQVDSRPRMQANNAAAHLTAPQPSQIPFAQIRLQDKNRVQVHYVQPELLHTIEFETTNQR